MTGAEAYFLFGGPIVAVAVCAGLFVAARRDLAADGQATMGSLLSTIFGRKGRPPVSQMRSELERLEAEERKRQDRERETEDRQGRLTQLTP